MVPLRLMANGSQPLLAQFKVGDLQKLERVGNSAYRVANGAAQPAAGEPRCASRILEMANVNPVHTMAMLIKTNRMFEFNTRALQPIRPWMNSVRAKLAVSKARRL